MFAPYRKQKQWPYCGFVENVIYNYIKSYTQVNITFYIVVANFRICVISIIEIFLKCASPHRKVWGSFFVYLISICFLSSVVTAFTSSAVIA